MAIDPSSINQLDPKPGRAPQRTCSLTDAKLRVVLCVGARDPGFFLGLTDEMGRGIRSVYYEVEVRDRGPRHREQRIRGIGDFADLRQQRMSWLVPDGE